ncbi:MULTISPECIES: type II secretion system protein GspM [unclassified Pseudomonas]|uniref:type II secretion system protein GspM n=1 Tax=unclassified Pseudomonas TaxID=196821 RepID=UPI001198DB72|nr:MULTISPECIES: type II secretion system protein GspM [unclassified Pseudomonas]TWC10530.1 general secretion pathway protein M [Pseudomonas sp. SJZ075]TWC26685.1 general secretion pathway protein M [Pseudomonas sp. SJZ078]TWC45858.1 general secretion pathway protein M [Pseudomonas sp. SJZ124]TWC46123.1 general secretion pathway protein M [Pseudomonas sp. SJZ080]TWC81127.1 general secretion pathway protein M [Pseudomonas sp. SJZ101]
MMDHSAWLVLKQGWRRITHREQELLVLLIGFVLVVGAYFSIWQPTRQRLDVAERQYLQQAELAAQIQRAEPRNGASVVTSPLSVQVNDSATAAGLDITEMNVDGEALRLIVSGDANRLLDWLDQCERDGATLQSLTLEARKGELHAQVVLRQ